MRFRGIVLVLLWAVAAFIPAGVSSAPPPRYPDDAHVPRASVPGPRFQFFEWARKQRVNFHDAGRETTPTRVVDPLGVPFRGLTWFKSEAGGAGAGWAVGYDARNQVLVAVSQADTAVFVEITRQTTPPPVRVARIDAGSLRTKQGLRLGSTRADVERVYGRATHEEKGHGLTQLRYSRKPEGNPDYQICTGFLLDGDKVVGIERSSGF